MAGEDGPVVVTPYSRFTCPVCERWYQARGGALFGLTNLNGDTVAICFLCARKLLKLGIIQKSQFPEGDPNTKRIVEI